MTMQPITLYSHPIGPNPWKVALILSALQIPYETVTVDFADVKKSPYVDLCPNGRLPTIVDPNKDITLWESGAIVNYLIETYDPSHRLSYDTFPERHQLQQWLHFQVSGQGPYYGQLGWFQRQPERVSLAIERYTGEIRRVMGVLDQALQGKEWLVGEKCTFVDLCFVPWQELVPFVVGDERIVQELTEQYPNVHAWMERMKAKPEVRKVLQEKSEAMAMAMAKSTK
ncbi:glutathione S-transferase family protein [Aspergillus homomorphus CBS 101889]|uniref:Glutathione-s-transferase theta, GST n=1 Tax=Aspergillus homomorphus (strain CBS 101889) TaxID=1450537 RepID=A0A395I1F2_ASPHC|nr:glutathione-s-transferase theta, GST [Aspergillus homomorphus CBS 101889]RAL13453.1 glutathione-s-transferase theta, GST [Aspergillus homomorphus CBS 101889]